MVAVLAPLWSLGCCDGAELGEMASLATFLAWADAVGIAECVLLPLNPPLIDRRLHRLRRALVTSALAAADEEILDEFFERFGTGYKTIAVNELFVIERCPYYCVSAFALSLLWACCPADGASRDIEKYFDILHASALSKRAANKVGQKLSWSCVWAKRMIRLVFRYRHSLIDVDAVCDALLGIPIDRDDHAAFSPATLALCDWALRNQYWAVSFALWEALCDEYCHGVDDSSVSDEKWPQYTPNWRDWNVGTFSDQLLINVLTGVGEDAALFQNTAQIKTSFVFSLFTQWTLEKLWHAQVRRPELRCRLVGDIPIYMPTCSADVWARPHLFQIDQESLRPKYVSGLPPDYWSDQGQLWGSPCYDWDGAYDSLCEFWGERVRQNRKLYDVVRIDHYRAFADFWAVPEPVARETRSSTKGAWREGPGAKFFHQLLAAQDLCSTIFVVEDLGEETEPFLKMRNELRFVNMSVLQFLVEEALGAGELVVRPGALVFSSTHDTPTLQGWFDEMDSTRKASISKLTGIPIKLLNSCIAGRSLLGWLLQQCPTLALPHAKPCFNPTHQPDRCVRPMSSLCVQLQDFLSCPTRINLPGKITGDDLWSWCLAPEDWTTLNTSAFAGWLSSFFPRNN